MSTDLELMTSYLINIHIYFNRYASENYRTIILYLVNTFSMVFTKDLKCKSDLVLISESVAKCMQWKYRLNGLEK